MASSEKKQRSSGKKTYQELHALHPRRKQPIRDLAWIRPVGDPGQESYCSKAFVDLDNKKPFVAEGSYVMTFNDSLFHGSNQLFQPPYFPNRRNNSFSPFLAMPHHWSTKRTGKGYIYEYKL